MCTCGIIEDLSAVPAMDVAPMSCLSIVFYSHTGMRFHSVAKLLLCSINFDVPMPTLAMLDVIGATEENRRFSQ